MRRWVELVTVAFVLVGLFAPILANDVPIVARAGGELRFPVVAFYLGEHTNAPDGRVWKEWWYELEDGSDDWAVMPLIPIGPNEVHAGRTLGKPVPFVHYLGNDDASRDVLVRLIHGTQTALWIAIGSVVIALLIGVVLGAVAGYWGGLVDLGVSGLVQVFLCFPPFFFVLAVMVFLQKSILSVILVLGSLYWVSFARIVRGEFLSLRERDFVKCARGLGVGPARLMVRHMLPAARGPILVNAAMVGASAVVVEATLSFFGLGLGLNTISWGGLLMQGKAQMPSGAWHLWLFPGLVLVGAVACLHTWADRVGSVHRA